MKRIGDYIEIPCQGCSIEPPFSWKVCLQCQRERKEFTEKDFIDSGLTAKDIEEFGKLFLKNIDELAEIDGNEEGAQK